MTDKIENDCDPLDTPLPCEITIGATTFGKGVALRALVNKARRDYELIRATTTPKDIAQAAAVSGKYASTRKTDETCPNCGAHPGDLTIAWLDGAHCEMLKISDPAVQKRLAAQWGYVKPDDLEALHQLLAEHINIGSPAAEIAKRGLYGDTLAAEQWEGS